jgi:hypothetical protein
MSDDETGCHKCGWKKADTAETGEGWRCVLCATKEVDQLRANLTAAREEIAKLRAAWPSSENQTTNHVIYKCVSGHYFMYSTETHYDTPDQAINAAAGIEEPHRE